MPGKESSMTTSVMSRSQLSGGRRRRWKWLWTRARAKGGDGERKERWRVGEIRKVSEGDRRKRRRGRSKLDPHRVEVQELEEEIDEHRSTVG